ncbi:hypothetical protein [Actinomadura gamaensis]|uniref:Secreted protein n=1 Tax=Actinomadura gamaensis TaxID=1763541 RepID=A0ABV9TZT8_9ACTN
MLKRFAAAGLLSVTAAGVAMSAAPAMADIDTDNTHNIQIVGVQTCRGLDIAGIGAAIHNILGITDESGDCVNGSTSVHEHPTDGHHPDHNLPSTG